MIANDLGPDFSRIHHAITHKGKEVVDVWNLSGKGTVV